MGALKPIGSLSATAVNALGSPTSLARLNTAVWGCVAVGFAGAWLGSSHSLVGLIYGVGTGWLLRAVVAGWFAAHLLARSSDAAPRTGGQQIGNGLC